MAKSAPPNAPYAPAERAFARTLIHAHGSLSAARAHLEQLWVGPESLEGAPGRVPTLAHLARWRDDPGIPIDSDIVAQFGTMARSFVIGSAFRIAEAAEVAAIAAIADDNPAAARMFTQVWALATDKLQPRDTSGAFGPIPRGLGPGQKFTAMTTFTVEGESQVEAPARSAVLIEERVPAEGWSPGAMRRDSERAS